MITSSFIYCTMMILLNTFSLHSDGLGELLRWGVFEENKSYRESFDVCHKNGVLAWGGLYQNDRAYSSEKAKFFHSNGNLAWGGFNQKKISFMADNAKFFHFNSQVAWGGLDQQKLTFSSDNAKFYYNNGKILWGGLNQQELSYVSESAKFFHSNGNLAWSGFQGGKVYYANGNVAWNGSEQSNVYDSNGKVLGKADYVDLYLGENSWLSISSKEETSFKLELSLGEGYKLKISKLGVVLDLYDKIFDLDKEF